MPHVFEPERGLGIPEPLQHPFDAGIDIMGGSLG
ncbi:hypothetical protein L286_06505 [Sphingobium sp. HDIP04]|nr:hypothetical protein L286_06505 [Sphingobium sp. HDIP04]